MDIKRKKSEVIWITIWLSLSVIWISFLTYLAISFGLSWSKETTAAVVFGNIPTIAFLYGFFSMLKSKVYIKTIEFNIHKYDRWDYNSSEYKTLYLTERVSQYANFTYYKYTGESTDYMTQSELEDYCNNLTRGYDDFIGYNTKEQAMRAILELVRDIIKEEKSEVNIKIKNVGAVQTFTIEELREMAEEHTYVTIADGCPDEYWYSEFPGRRFRVKQCTKEDINVEGFSDKNPDDCVWVTEDSEHFGALIDKNHTKK